MSTWPQPAGLRRPLRGAGIIEVRTAKRGVRPCRSDSSQQASSKPGAVQFTCCNVLWVTRPALRKWWRGSHIGQSKQRL